MMTTIVAAAAVIPTGVSFTVVVMMVAANIGIVCQTACQESLHSCIRISADTAKQMDTGRCQSHLGTATDATADQNIGLGTG